MAGSRTWEDRRSRLLDRAIARVAGRARVKATLGTGPEPRGSGRFARGRHLIAGRFLLAGEWHEAPDTAIWDLPAGPLAEDERQGFAWLEDLAAVGDGKARERAQSWVTTWIDRFGRGRGPGWRPDITGRRVLHWIGQSALIRRGLPPAAESRFADSLARQVIFLSRRWKGAAPGLPRFHALGGLIHGALALQGMSAQAGAAVVALSRECDQVIDASGAIATRNPEELCDILALLIACSETIEAAGQERPEPLRAAITRIAPTLRALRQADGGLARFHGGGRGADGRLDSALAAAGNRDRRDGLAMGFARLAAGRTTLVMDAAPPPTGPASARAHAATLAFELTSGRRPLIVNCGAGDGFGADWRRAGRATASQSTLGIDGYSSARFAAAGSDHFGEIPDHVPGEFATTETSHRFGAAHNGWLRTHGLTHARTLDLTFDGRAVTGEELLIALADSDQTTFNRVRAATPGGIAWSLRFHLHPEAEAELDLGGTAISIALKSGEVWVFRQDGATQMALAPSVYLESGGRAPRATTQVVLSGRAMSYATRVRWSLAKAQDTPNVVRDLGPGADGAEEDDG